MTQILFEFFYWNKLARGCREASGGRLASLSYNPQKISVEIFHMIHMMSKLRMQIFTIIGRGSGDIRVDK